MMRFLTGAGCALLLAASAPASARPAAASAEEARYKEIVRAAFARWSAGGTDFFDELLAPDVEWTIKGSGPTAGVYRGRRRFIERAVTPFGGRLSRPVRPELRHVWAEGDYVIVNWDGRATARDGRPYENSYLWIFRMADGKVTRATAFLDLVPYDDIIRRVPAPARSRR